MSENYVANMGEVRIQKDELIKIINQNKEKHDNLYKEAVDGYWSKATSLANEALAKISSKERLKNDTIYLEFPENHADDYETALQQLALSVDTVVKLNTNEFKQYVRNQWHWKNSFLTKNSFYLTGSNPSGCANF